MYKKIKIFILLLLVVFSLSACSMHKKNKEVLMDKPAKDGQYHYKNKDLGFSLILDQDFIYYQTQRKKIGNTRMIEFFVPTSDSNYSQEVPGYGKPLTISIFNLDYWDGLKDNQNEKAFYQEIKRNKNNVYAFKFWDNVPKDWKNKWNKEKEEELIKNFRLID